MILPLQMLYFEDLSVGVGRRRTVGEGETEESESEYADGEADEDHGTTRLFKAVDLWPE